MIVDFLGLGADIKDSLSAPHDLHYVTVVARPKNIKELGIFWPSPRPISDFLGRGLTERI